MITESSIRYFFAKHKDLFEKFDLYPEQLARMLYYFVSQIYISNGRLFEGFQKKYEGSSLAPHIYGEIFLKDIKMLVAEELLKVRYDMRLDRQIKRALKLLFSLIK
jgi:hypothetical protein